MNEPIEIRDRVKIIREHFELSQAEFGKKLSLERSAISLIERKQRNITDRTIKDICREFNIDYIWLTTGIGEMFVGTDDDFLEKIDRIMAGENETRKNLFKSLSNASDDDIQALDRIISLYVEAQKENGKN